MNAHAAGDLAKAYYFTASMRGDLNGYTNNDLADWMIGTMLDFLAGRLTASDINPDFL